MSHGRIRGYRPPVLPLAPKPKEGAADKARVLLKPQGPVLGPGQHIVLPGRTGLAHLRDHFDARQQPDYEARLKGEARRPEEGKDAALQQPQVPVPDSSFSPAALAAEAMLRRLPSTEEPEVSDEEEGQHGEEGAEEGGVEEPPFDSRTVELQGGLFTLAEGSLDAEQHPLATLEAFLDGDVAVVSVAVDLAVIPYGLPLSIPALDAAWGRPIAFRALHQTERTAGAGFAYLEICVSATEEQLVRAIDRPLTVTFG
jgi:hypothetical protein